VFLGGCASQNRNIAEYEGDANRVEEKKETPGDHLSFLDAYDPFESLNRRVYRFNTVVDDNILEPVTRAYEKVVPVAVRDRIRNFFSNIGDVLVMGNCLLQGKGEKTGEVLGRLMVNTTVGFFGLWDPATKIGLIKYQEDFGQTLGVYGVNAGPYLILPILGPSTLRDTGGMLADSFSKTLAVGALQIDTATDLALSTVDGLEFRASLPFSYGDFDSPFEYDLVRTLYLDMRELLIHDGSYTEENRKADSARKTAGK
jgi:phospholipid-binding lipoprotein MlaA